MATYQSVRLNLKSIKLPTVRKYHYFAFDMQDAEKIQTKTSEEQLKFFQALITRKGLEYQVTNYLWYNPEVIQPWELKKSLSDPESTI